MQKIYIILIFGFLALSTKAQDIQTSLNLQRDVRLTPGQTYTLYSTVTIGSGQSLYVPPNTTLVYEGASYNPAITINNNGTLLGEGTLIAENPNVYTESTPKHIGIMVSGSNCRIDFGKIQGFEYGVYLNANNVGVAYNNISIGQIYDAIHFVKLQASGSGYVSMNNIHVDRMSISNSTFMNDSVWQSTYAIYMDSQSPNAPYLNKFSGSVELVNTGGYITGYYNNIDGLRLEAVPHMFEIRITTYGTSPLSNRWYGEFSDGLNWNNITVDTGLRKRETMQMFGVRNFGLWETALRISGNGYFQGVWQRSCYDVYYKGKRNNTIKDPLRLLTGVTGRYSHYYVDTDSVPTPDSSYVFDAKQVRKSIPFLVKKDDDNLFINYTGFIPIIVEAMKEQDILLQEQEEQIATKQNQLFELSEQLDSLEQKLAELSNKRNQPDEKKENISQNDNLSLITPPNLNNYPNPFDEHTVINYQISQEYANKQLFIFNMQGTLIQQIELHESVGTFTFERKELPSGLYFCTMVCDGLLLTTKKMIIK